MKLRPTTYILKIQSTSPHPDKGRLTCVGYMRLGGSVVYVKGVKESKSERRILAEIQRLMRDCHICITWGGMNLEFPFLSAKMLRYGLDPSPLYHIRHIDLAETVSKHLRLSGDSLQEACKFFGVPVQPLRARGGKSAGVGGDPMAACRAQVVAVERLVRKLLPLILALNPDLPSLL